MIGPTTERPSRIGPSRLGARVFMVSVAVTLLPIIVATMRAIHRRWLPLSDDAYFAIRARDVLSYHHFPLLGLASSASLSAATTLNHPGPLLFDALALPVRVFGGGTGVALGIGLLNAGAVIGIAVFAFRRGGPAHGAAAMAVTAGLCWSMGSEALFEPWQPYALMVPFLCFLILVWSVACGDLVALPFAAVVGSLLLQTHLSYALLVPLLAVWAVVGLVLTLRRDRQRNPESWPAIGPRVVRTVSIAGLVLGACWIQPLIDEVNGGGNIGHLVANASPPKHVYGYGSGLRLVASVVSLPPWWFRPSIPHTFISSSGWRFPSLALAAGSLVLLVGVFAMCAWLARRRQDRDVVLALATAAVGLLAGLLTAARVPITRLGLEAHVFRWLWPLSTFTFLVVAVALARSLPRERIQPTMLVGVFAVSAILFAAFDLPTTATTLTPNAREDAIPATRALDAKLGVLRGKGPILIDQLFTGRFADPYGTAVVAEIQRRGIPFVTADPVLVHQLGTARRATAKTPRSQLFLRVGNDPLALPPGTRKVAEHEGLTRSEQRELSALKAQIRVYLRTRRLHLTRDGQAALARGLLPDLGNPSSNSPIDPDRLFLSGELVVLVTKHDLVLDGPWIGRFRRFADLQSNFDNHTVALFLAPLR